MNIVTEANISGKPIERQAAQAPGAGWCAGSSSSGSLLAVLVGGLVWFNYFRGKMIAQFFANNKPPPVSVSVAEAKSEVIPNLLTAVGDLAAVHQVNVTSDVNGRITEIMFTAGRDRQGGHAAGAVVRRAGAGRSRQLQGAGNGGAAVARPRQATGLAPVRAAGDRRHGAGGVRPGPGRHRQDRSHHLAEAGARAVRRRARRSQGRGRPVSDRGHARSSR